ncbi:WbuC family cupin fold metalloprotein [Campylobacter fetus]|uniref:WbuC family cupin fold metalloprotein n=1 Tax=Campylobacter fetus TaxID=196 RepID=UPI000818B91A|nr:WbuC family cupin fold metalloprotein [Campylobacter fetus]EEP0885868.1 cupin fold metalloprotein, WbuC family [Campylobacter fetus]EFU4396773.1 cupin fold metalloprotein, WbuC family [Campylobacter fetus]EGK8147672.1 cupin fold metalloprotein, WbuC family [Campylobacter fetus]EGK8151181.1 cupin fold metalloprotein, WbuC family [Campylobacter fetus]EGK8153286.1 cupin fold metalloprotein, WbuC family [Campylobacter fetus]
MILSEKTADKNAKTPTFFIGECGSISEQNINELKKYALKNNTTARLNLFSDSTDLLQYMLIFHPYKKDIKCQKFIEQSSIYMALDGNFSITLYNDDMSINKEFVLNKKLNKTVRIPKNTFYKMEMISDQLLFIEIRNGPFKRENQIII